MEQLKHSQHQSAAPGLALDDAVQTLLNMDKQGAHGLEHGC